MRYLLVATPHIRTLHALEMEVPYRNRKTNGPVETYFRASRQIRATDCNKAFPGKARLRPQTPVEILTKQSKPAK